MQKKQFNETFYKLDGNIYKIINKDNKINGFLYEKSKGFIAEINPYDIMLNGSEIKKDEVTKFIIKISLKR